MSTFTRVLGFLFIGLLMASPWLAHAVSISRTDVEMGQHTERVVFFTTRPVAVSKHFTLQNPSRLVIDFPYIESGDGVGLSQAYSGSALKNIRFGRPNPDTSRIVLDTVRDATGSYDVTVLSGPPRVVVELRMGGVSQGGSSYRPMSTPTRQVAGYVPSPQPKPQLEAKEAAKPVIVLDAGHGGKDDGATGRSGLREKVITLQYARALRHALLKTGRYHVVLTRDSDKYLFLKDRVDIARKNKGELFISIHADSNPKSDAKGLSVYTISEKASDAESAALAKQENKADVIGGIDLSVEDESVANILIDLASRETRNKGSRFAEMLIDHMHPKVPLLANTHRYAGFRVLKAPDIPSVLVEIGFLSNREDEKRIQTREYQDKVVRSMVAAIDGFFGF